MLSDFKVYIKFIFLYLALDLATYCDAKGDSIDVMLNVYPPYSAYLSDYFSYKVYIQLKNNLVKNRPVRIWASLTRVDNGGMTYVRIDSGKAPLIDLPLAPNARNLTGADLESIFSLSNLHANPPNILYGNFPLDAGEYELCIEIYDSEFPYPSLGGDCQDFTIDYPDPPIISQPICDDTVSALQPQAVMFQWNLPSAAIGKYLAQSSFTLRIVDVIPTTRDPNDAMNSETTPAFFERSINGLLYVYGPSDPLLIPGHKYAARVTVNDNGAGIAFKNNGVGEVCAFTYGRPGDTVLVSRELRDSHLFSQLANSKVQYLNCTAASGAECKLMNIRFDSVFSYISTSVDIDPPHHLICKFFISPQFGQKFIKKFKVEQLMGLLSHTTIDSVPFFEKLFLNTAFFYDSSYTNVSLRFVLNAGKHFTSSSEFEASWNNGIMISTRQSSGGNQGSSSGFDNTAFKQEIAKDQPHEVEATGSSVLVKMKSILDDDQSSPVQCKLDSSMLNVKLNSSMLSARDSIARYIFSFYKAQYSRFDQEGKLKIQNEQDPEFILKDVQGIVTPDKRWEKLYFVFSSVPDLTSRSALIKCIIFGAYAYSISTPKPDAYDDHCYCDTRDDRESLTSFRIKTLDSLVEYLSKIK